MKYILLFALLLTISCDNASTIWNFLVKYVTKEGAGGIMGNFLGKKGAQGIKVDISGKEIMLDVYITVDYGTKIPDIAWEIQDRVKKELENMTGMIVTTVNVHIQGINYDKKEAKTDKEG